MLDIEFRTGTLTADEHATVVAGFRYHSEKFRAPPYEKRAVCWLLRDEAALVGALTAYTLWDWLYIDELWIDEAKRGQGLGRSLVERAEAHARSETLVGIWLWTQSWQAPDFYKALGYEEFSRLEDSPRGYAKIGMRKKLS